MLQVAGKVTNNIREYLMWNASRGNENCKILHLYFFICIIPLCFNAWLLSFPNSSSGQVVSGDACAGTTTRTITFAQGECQINQIALNSSGSVLYAAAGNTVRMWDLNRYMSKERLSKDKRRNWWYQLCTWACVRAFFTRHPFLKSCAKVVVSPVSMLLEGSD